MTDRREPWRTNAAPDHQIGRAATCAAGPFITIGEVEHGNQRFLIVTPTGEQIVEGFQEARRLAHKLAGV